MTFEIELAKRELEIAEDMEKVSAGEALRWIKQRRAICTPEIVAAIERAVMAMGTAKRIRSTMGDKYVER